MSKFPPTAEQKDAVQKFRSGKSVKLTAYAGAGKTSTMVLMAESTNDRGHYMSFNKSIATEARSKFPERVGCSTTHSLAYRAQVRDFGQERMGAKVNGGLLAAKRLVKAEAYGPLALSARSHGFLVAETIARFCRSGSSEIAEHHVPTDGRIDLLPDNIAAQLERNVVKHARTIWDRMSDPKGDLPIGHDGYLKRWVMSRPAIDADYILLDEAQDTNGVVMDLVRHQQCQLVTVGDAQQQIYEWRGARNAMTELPAELEGRLSTSWRFGEAIATHATRVLTLLGETHPLKGAPGKASALEFEGRADAILSRGNGTVIRNTLAALAEGRRPYIVGGVSEILAVLDAADKLMAGTPVEFPIDFFGFQNWTEVVEASEQSGGEDLARWVKLIDEHGTGPLREQLLRLPKDETRADVIFSTAHKAKGREWGRVKLSDDFLSSVPTKDKEGSNPLGGAEELRLYYVAATRAKDALDVHPEVLDRLRKIEAFRASLKMAA